MQRVDLDPKAFPDFPPTDASGDVDLGLVEYFLSLTPTQRLEHMQELVELIASAHVSGRLPASLLQKSPHVAE